MRVVRLKYAHSDPLFYKARVNVVSASNLESAQILLRGEACCGFVPVTLAAKYKLPVVPRVAIYSDGPVISSRLFRGSGEGYAAVDDTTVSALALKIALGIDFVKVSAIDGALSRYAGVLVIGDEALRLVDRGVPHIADVGEVWRSKVGTPLVYAVFAAAPGAPRRDVERAVEEVESSLLHFYENPAHVVEKAASRLGVSSRLVEAYYASVKYTVSPYVLRGLERQCSLMGLGELQLV